MCYTVKQLKEKALKRARHHGIKEDIIHYENELRQFSDYHAISGFAHPQLIIYTNAEPFRPVLSYWGLIPHWVKTEAQANQLRDKTLNARIETIFEKPSFKAAARTKHCLIPLDGFYEYHHYKGKSYPFYISSHNASPLLLAGLWSLWINKHTGEVINSCSIVTTRANALMTKIHNNPKIKEARMPLVLSPEKADQWLQGTEAQNRSKLTSFDKTLTLNAHTVKPLIGKKAVGNTAAASAPYPYEALIF